LAFDKEPESGLSSLLLLFAFLFISGNSGLYCKVKKNYSYKGLKTIGVSIQKKTTLVHILFNQEVLGHKVFIPFSL